MTKEDILDIAKELIAGDRERDYGDASESFQRIADLWTAYKGVEFTKKDVAVQMILVKASRLKTSDKPDNWVDIAGYAAQGGSI